MNALRRLLAWVDARPGAALAIVLLLGAALRVGLLASEGIHGDERRPFAIAASAARGEGFRYCNQYFPFCGPGNDTTAMLGPVPGLLFAAHIALFGEHAVASIVALQLLLGLATGACAHALARELFGSARAGVLASLLCVGYPHLARLELFPREETLFSFLLALGVWLAVRGVARERAALLAAAGAVLGLASLTRAALLWYPPLLALALLLALRGPLGRRARCAAALLAAFAAVLAPWVARNARAFDAFVPGTTLTGYNLYRHNHILERAPYLRYVRGAEGRDALAKLVARRSDLRGDENEAAMDRVYREEALAIIRAHPGRYLALALWRAAPLFTDAGVYASGLSPFWQLVALANLVLLALASASVWQHRAWRSPALLCVVLLILYNTAGHMAVNARLRYTVPVMPLVIVLAAERIAALAGRARVAASGESAITGGGAPAEL